MHRLRRVFAAVALALVLAPLAASAPLFDPDEGLHAAIAQEMVSRGDYVTPTFLGQPFLDKPILFFWAEAGSLRLFGNNEFAVRVPPLLFGLLGMLSVALLGREMFSQAAGLVSGIVYGTMILPLGVSQVAVHDVGLIPFMCLAAWCLVRAASSFARRVVLLAVLAGVALGLSILTKGLVGCVFAYIFAACLAVRRPAAIPRLLIALVIAGLLAGVVAAPWYVAMEHAHPGYLHYYFVERHLQGYLTATQRHAGRPWWYYVPIVLGGALPWTGYLLLAGRRARAESLRLVLWGWFVVGLVFLSVGESKLVTYALPLFPAVALLAGEAISSRRAEREPLFITAAAIHALVVALLPAAGLFAVRWRFGASNPDLWPFVGGAALLALYAAWRAARSDAEFGFMSWMGGAALVSLAGLMMVLPRAATWMTARDLATALNNGGTLPSRVSVLDERVGSLIFYLAPALRAQATPDRIDEVSFAEAVGRLRVDGDDAVLAMRERELERFRRLLPNAPEPDARAGTFVIFRAGSLRPALSAR